MDYLPQKANLLFLSVVPNAWHQGPGLTDVRLSSSGKESVSTVWQCGHFACNIKLLLLKPGELKVQEYYKSSFCEMFKKQTNKCLVPCSWTVFCLTVLSRLHFCVSYSVNVVFLKGSEKRSVSRLELQTNHRRSYYYHRDCGLFILEHQNHSTFIRHISWCPCLNIQRNIIPLLNTELNCAV